MSDNNFGYAISIFIISICIMISLYFGVYIMLKIINPKLRNDNSQQQYATKYTLIITILGIMSFIISIISSIFEPIYSFNHSKYGKEIDISAAISILFYGLGKFLSYVLFSYRLMYVFKDSTVAYGKKTYYCLYILLIIHFISLIAWNIGSTHNEDNPKAASWDNALNVISGAIFYLIDIILGITLPWLFIAKLYHLIPESYINDRQNSIIEMNNTNTLELKPQASNEKPDISTKQNSSDNDSNEASSKRIPSIPAIGISSANIQLTNSLKLHNQPSSSNISERSSKKINLSNANDYKYQQILNTTSRIALLSTITSISTIIVIILASTISIMASNNSGIVLIGQSLFKIDASINLMCLCLCYKWMDYIYLLLCNRCHNYYKDKQCCFCCCHGR